ncbi:MAG: DUF748 domain-containing protein, partial [Gemmatimonadales bacterium]|nr:DUF748 domain-containing protein [Gemmatimonadales bacterium]
MAPPKGNGEIRFAYRLGYEAGGMSMVLDGIAATIRELGIAGTEAAEPGIRIDTIALAGGQFDLQARSASIESLDVTGGRIAARRGADGAIDIASWFASPDEALVGTDTTAAAPTTGADGDAWRFEIGRVGIDGIALRYLDEGFARPLTAEAGKLQVGFKAGGAAGAGGPQLQLEELGIALSEISLAADGIEDPVLGLAGLTLESGRLDLGERSMSADLIRLENPRLVGTRGADGTIAVLDAFAPADGAAAASGAKRAEAKDEAKRGESAGAGSDDGTWAYRLGELRLEGGEVMLSDASVKPAAALGLTDIHVKLADISEDLAAQWPLEAGFAVREGGRLEASGTVVAGTPSGDLKLRLSGLGLALAQPYLSQFARLRIVGGSLASEGRLRFGGEGLRYDGSADIRGLDLHELDTKETLLGWKSLSTKALSVREDRVGIGELVLDGLRSKLVIFEDRSVNVARVIGPAEAQGHVAPTAARESAQAKASGPAGAPAFKVGIERLRLVDGDVDFADLSLALPFGTRVHELKGELAGLSNDPGSAATIALDGKVDEFGSAKVGGEINLFAPAEHTDAKVEFRNVEMTNLTPYSATFAGRHIASGKLSLDLQYRIEQQQLQGDNRIVMEQLTLGEKVDAEGAPDLPLDLAVAILKDSQGRIDLGLPVAGSLEDPQFSFGGLIGKALLGLVTRIVTAPFRALGALFGGGEGVDMSQIAFDAGGAEL